MLIHFILSNTIKLPSKYLLEATSFYNTFWRIIKTSIITIILASALQLAYNVASAEYFSSVDSLQKLGDVEMGLLQVFRDYLEVQDKELESYQRFVDHVKLQHSMALEDFEDYLGNPINAFTLIKRMVKDWNNLNQFIKESQSRSPIHNSKLKNEILEESEFKGAVKGLIRLQQVYNMSINDLANGKINNVYIGNNLNWHDCFEIAAYLYDEQQFSQALMWFELVLHKLKEIKNNKKDAIQHRFKIETLEYLALSNYKLGNSEKAIEYIDEILMLQPNHRTKDLSFYILNSPPKQLQAKRNVENDNNYNFIKNYTQLCRGIRTPQKELRNLKCLVETRNNPQFILAPLKIEQLSLDPDINLYHGLLTSIQIDRILDEAHGQMFRSEVGNATHIFISDERISQQAWLSYESPATEVVYRLVEQITGLDLVNSEALQVANYGIGGQFDAHYDFISPTMNFEPWIGSRLTTNMFYLSDVEQGGFTVFPHINVFVRPVKGSLISWYNLHKSLDPDLRALHAGCPVIIGSKRIANIWVHSGFQELRHPCELKSDTFKSEVFKNVAPRYFK